MDNDSLVTISDNGTDNLSVSEDQADNLSVVIRLNSEPTKSVTISFTNTDTDADENNELTLSSDSLNFSTSNWNDNQTLTISANDEDFDVDNKSLSVSFDTTSSDSLYSNGNKVRGQLNLIKIDNDSSGITLSMVDNYTSEASVDGNTGNFTAVLTSKPLYKVAMKFQVDNTSAGVNLNEDTLIFTNANWSTSQNIVFKAVDDSFDEGDNGTDNQTFVISIKKICSATDPEDSETYLKNSSIVPRVVKTQPNRLTNILI